MHSLARVAGSYLKIYLQTWYLCLAIYMDHTYNTIPSPMGLNVFLCTVFRANMTWTLELYVAYV